MAEMFTRAELAGIIGCADKELSDLIAMYDRQGINIRGSALYHHLCSIIKKAKGLADELEKGGITKILTSSMYGEQRNGWMPARIALPKDPGEYIVTIDRSSKPTCYFYDPMDQSWYTWADNETMAMITHTDVIAWMPLPEAYNAK